MRKWAAGIAFLLCVVGARHALPQSSSAPWPGGCSEGTLGAQGQPDYQLTLTCLPQGTSWNGNLFVYAHGFVNPQDPLALPADELGQVGVGDQSMIQFVMSRGYAFATTSYSRNGWAVEQGSVNLNALVEKFKAGAPSELKHVLIVGSSEGGLITAMQLEKFPDTYSGGLSLCGAVDGGQHQVQYIGDFRAVFDYYFPGIFNFGIVDIPQDAPSQWQSRYSPAISQALQANPGAAQSLFQVTHAAEDSSDPSGSRNTTAQAVLGYNIFETPDLIRIAGGNPYDNTATQYSGSSDDQALNSHVERVAADHKGVDYLNQYYETTGDLQHPLVSLHNLQDPKVPYQHEVDYSRKVASKGKFGNLNSIPVPGYGHCAFKAPEILGALTLLLARTESL